MRWTFTVLTGADANLTYECTGDDLVIVGASEQAHLRLRGDRFISGLHCLVETRGARCLLRDLKSMNGTWINGRRIVMGEIGCGDQFRVGATVVGVAGRGAASSSAPAENRCVRCGRAANAHAGEEGLREFVCTACRASESKKRKRTVGVRVPAICQTCWGDMSEVANLDGRAVELGEVASYLCDRCAVPGSHSHPTPLKSVGPYQILELVGRGGFGEVWRARHVKTGRMAAVKIALPSLLSNEERAAGWFHREMAIARELVHPHIVRWYDSGAAEDTIFFATEYVGGGDLERALRPTRDGNVTVELAVHFAVQALRALEYAHGRGIVHRDVKPANLLRSRTPEGRVIVKVGDFGLAKCFHSAGSTLLTKLGEARGTPLYMAPEQLRNFRYVGPSADVYAVGVTLYQLLSGATPFDTPSRPENRSKRSSPLKANSDLLRMVLEDERVPILVREPNLNKALAAVVDVSVRRDPGDRFGTAAEFRAALERAAELL